MQRVLALPVALLATSIFEVFHSRMARSVREAPERAIPFFFAISACAFAVGLVPVLLVVIFAEPASVLIFGKQWAIAGQMARVYAPTVLALFAVISICRTGFVCDGQRIKFVYDIFSLVSVAGVLLWAPKQGLGPVATVGMLSVAVVVGYAIHYCLLYGMVKRFVRGR